MHLAASSGFDEKSSFQNMFPTRSLISVTADVIQIQNIAFDTACCIYDSSVLHYA